MYWKFTKGSIWEYYGQFLQFDVRAGSLDIRPDAQMMFKLETPEVTSLRPTHTGLPVAWGSMQTLPTDLHEG